MQARYRIPATSRATVTSRHSDITVIVTNYNYGDFLEEAVASVLAQEGGPPQVIVVDDGSTDPDTLEVLDRLPEGVRLIRGENAGVASARNVGLAAAETPFLMILDADDRLRPRALSLLRATLEADPALGFTYGITRFFGEWEGEMTMPPYDPYKLLYRHTIGTTCLMRRELVADVGGFDADFGGYEDWEFWLHALQKGWHGRRVEEITFEYRRHGSTKLTADRLEYRRWFKRLRSQARRSLRAPSTSWPASPTCRPSGAWSTAGGGAHARCRRASSIGCIRCCGASRAGALTARAPAACA